MYYGKDSKTYPDPVFVGGISGKTCNTHCDYKKPQKAPAELCRSNFV